jgi:hypothetical protein
MGEPSAVAMPAGVKKIPTAMTSPTTSAAAVRKPICRFNSGVKGSPHGKWFPAKAQSRKGTGRKEQVKERLISILLSFAPLRLCGGVL